MIGKNRGDARAAGRQSRRERGIVELDPDDEWRRLDLRRGNGHAGCRDLPGRDRLQYCFNTAGVDLSRKRLEGDLDRLTARDVAGVDLLDFGAQQRFLPLLFRC
jgi:hypothetical protein